MPRSGSPGRSICSISRSACGAAAPTRRPARARTPLSGGQSVLLLALILLVEAGWYALVATAFSARRPRAAYLRAKAWVDRAAAVVLGLIGLRLLAGAVRSG